MIAYQYPQEIDHLNLSTIEDRVVVDPLTQYEQKSVNGLIKLTPTQKDVYLGVVQFTGPGIKNKKTNHVNSPDLVRGDVVLFVKTPRSDITINGKKCLIVRANEHILALVGKVTSQGIQLYDNIEI